MSSGTRAPGGLLSAENALAALSRSVENALAGMGTSLRGRTAWNDRFCHWEQPASVSEAGTIERAEALVSRQIAQNQRLRSEGVTVRGQGSYHNNTNVRTEADIDLRAVHPILKVDYATNVAIEYADQILSYLTIPRTVEDIVSDLRAILVKELSTTFGNSNVDPGKKAIRLKGVTGSRAELDIVPVVRYHHVTWMQESEQYRVVEGVAIYGTNGLWTCNFPEQHARNGIAKRERTKHRFKRIVRIFKRLRSDLTEKGLLKVEVPSFLIECLVYCVEDAYFLVETDDRYDRVRRVALRLRSLLMDPEAESKLHEINDIKWLFHQSQPWRRLQALAFVDAVIAALGNS